MAPQPNEINVCQTLISTYGVESGLQLVVGLYEIALTFFFFCFVFTFATA